MSEPGPEVPIRVATPADAAAISRLEGLSGSTRRSLVRDLARAASQDAGAPVVLVAEGAPDADPDADPDTEVVGAALGLLQYDEGHVLDLAVAPAWRRHGVGARLLRALLATLLAQGARAMTLEVRAGNLGAQALYRAAGFTTEGRRPSYYPDGEDALLLWWRPASPAAGTDAIAATPPTNTTTRTNTTTPTNTTTRTGGHRC